MNHLVSVTTTLIFLLGVTNEALSVTASSASPEAFYQASDGGDFGVAFNRALSTGNKIIAGSTTYNIASTIRYQRSGQIIEGCGNGYATDVGRTILKWTGSIGGRVISFAKSPGTGGVSNAQLRDLDVDGNQRANIGVEVYDNDASKGGGNWRNSLSHVTIRGVEGGNFPHAIELGHSNSAPNFANDFAGYSVGIFNSNIGIWLNGSTESFYNSTVGFNSNAGFRIEEGGNLQLHSCICQQNGIDIEAHNPGSIAIFGGSFQNSANGIIVLDRGSTQNSIGIFGAFLHTFSKERMFDFQAAAGGVAIVGSFVPADSSSRLVTGVNPNYSFTLLGTTGLSGPH
jgi:hypothetical protein